MRFAAAVIIVPLLLAACAMPPPPPPPPPPQIAGPGLGYVPAPPPAMAAEEPLVAPRPYMRRHHHRHCHFVNGHCLTREQAHLVQTRHVRLHRPHRPSVAPGVTPPQQ
jgi:hypothetical protein